MPHHGGMATHPVAPDRHEAQDEPMGTFEALLLMLVVGVCVAVAVGAML